MIPNSVPAGHLPSSYGGSPAGRQGDKFQIPNSKFNGGQVMLLTVLIISGTILGVTTIAGLLMLHQIRQTTNVVDSLQAIYAADAGLEWRLYQSFVDSGRLPPQLGRADFITEEVSTADQIEFRSVGCAGALLEGAPAGQCPRRLNRSLQLMFKVVE